MFLVNKRKVLILDLPSEYPRQNTPMNIAIAAHIDIIVSTVRVVIILTNIFTYKFTYILIQLSWRQSYQLFLEELTDKDYQPSDFEVA
jgi:hypothetical protein